MINSLSKDDCVQFCKDQMQNQFSRQEITSQLMEMGVAQATSYRYYREAQENWDDPQKKEEDLYIRESLEDQKKALNAIRDALNDSLLKGENELIAKFALDLLKARKLCRSI